MDWGGVGKEHLYGADKSKHLNLMCFQFDSGRLFEWKAHVFPLVVLRSCPRRGLKAFAGKNWRRRKKMRWKVRIFCNPLLFLSETYIAHFTVIFDVQFYVHIEQFAIAKTVQ